MAGNGVITNQYGAALLQMILISTVIGITAYFMTQFVINSDRKGIRIIHRHDNLSLSNDLADFVNDWKQVKAVNSVVSGQYQ